MHFARARSLVIAAAAVGLLVLASGSPVSVGVAHAGEQATPGLNVAVLTPCCGNPVPNATGLAQANILSKPNTLEVETFSGSVTIPEPGSSLAIDNGQPADIRLVLSRAGADYAECFLVPAPGTENARDPEEEETFLVNIVKARLRWLTLFRQFAGFCDLDLSTSTIDPGVPAVLAGDVVTAESVVDSVRTPFLQGVFVQQ